MPNSQQNTFPTIYLLGHTECLEKLSSFIQEYCHQHPKRSAIELAVTELVVNAIKHGQATKLSVTINEQGNYCDVIVTDNGKAFNPKHAKAKPMGQLREHGYGLGIIQNLTKDLSYSRQGQQNHLRLRFSRNVS